MTTYKGFRAKYFLDDRKGIIRGTVLNIRDTITFYGKTVPQVSKAFRDSVDEYLAFCAEEGVEPEKPFSGRILVRMPPSMHRRLSLEAQQRGISINKLIRGKLASTLKSPDNSGGAVITVGVPSLPPRPVPAKARRGKKGLPAATPSTPAPEARSEPRRKSSG
jgi:predicted HicB family RNase H-like nuclease